MKVLVVKKFKKSAKYVKVANEDLLFQSEINDKELNLNLNDNHMANKDKTDKYIFRISYDPKDLIINF